MRISFRVTGRVQGVGFRLFARGAAQRSAVGGWVANAPDGSVHGEAEGPEARLEAFRAELQQGPAFGRVDHLAWTVLEAEDASPPASPSPLFDIRR